MNVQGDHAFDGKHPCQAPTFSFQAQHHHCSSLCVSLQQMLLTKKGTECHKPKPTTPTARGRVKPLLGSSKLSSALWQQVLCYPGTPAASLQLLPRTSVGDPATSICIRILSSLVKTGQNDRGCAVDMHYPKVTSFRKGAGS